MSFGKNSAFSSLLVVVIVVVVVVAVVAAVFILGLVYPVGNQKTESYSNTGFNSLAIGSVFQVSITQADTYNVTVTAGERVFSQIEVSQSGNTLTIGLEPSFGFNLGALDLQAQIMMPKLDSVEFSGATHGTAQGFQSQDPFTATVSGASTLEMTSFQAGNIAVNLSGASTFTASGTAGDLTSTVSGASNLNLQSLTVNNANLNVSGASQATVDVNGRLDANASGASHVTYAGSPTLGSIVTSGASSINSVG